MPKTIGGVEQGSSFSVGSFNGQNWPLSEVIRKILYPYVPPSLSFNISVNGVDYLSTGLTQSSLFSYTITKYSNDIFSYSIIGTTYSGSYFGDVGTSMSATFSFNLFSNSTGTQSYVLFVRDNNSLLTFSYSATASIRFAHPIFCGFSHTAIDLYSGNASLRASQTGTIMNSSTRFARPYINSPQSVSFPLGGSGYIYIMIPWLDYPLVSSIKDPNGFVIHDSDFLNISSFTYSGQVVPTGANNLPTGIGYRVYRTIATCSYEGVGNFEFNL